MIILQRYITRNLMWSTLLALFILISLFSFFTLIDQLEDTRGSYGTFEALMYVLLITPRIAYDLFPIAAVIGSMTALGLLSRTNELDIIMTSGLSRFSFVLMMVRSSFFLIIFSVLIGELLAPAAEERAQTLRSLALSENITLKTRYGFWIRDGNSYVNIRRVLPGNRIEDIYFYDFDNNYNLISSFHAESAEYLDDQWMMKDINESLVSDEKVESRYFNKAAWNSLINPEIINVVTVKPQYLTMLGLANYINYLNQNAQDAQLYEQALWIKMVKPFSIVAMIIMAIPLVQGRSRDIAVDQRVFIGAMVGILFHISNQISQNLGIVYQIPAEISVTAPTIILVMIILYLLRPNKL
jgi:lipopolysaccharide export system permease protein